MHLAAASCWTHGVLYLEIQKVYAAIYPVLRRRRRCHVVLATAKLQVARPILELLVHVSSSSCHGQGLIRILDIKPPSIHSGCA